jgi:hypothetical protein
MSWPMAAASRMLTYERLFVNMLSQAVVAEVTALAVVGF